MRLFRNQFTRSHAYIALAFLVVFGGFTLFLVYHVGVLHNGLSRRIIATLAGEQVQQRTFFTAAGLHTMIGAQDYASLIVSRSRSPNHSMWLRILTQQIADPNGTLMNVMRRPERTQSNPALGIDLLKMGYKCTEHVTTPAALHVVLTKKEQTPYDH